MGLFSKKDKPERGGKSHPDLLNPVSTAPPPSNTNTNPAQQHSQNSYHDSAFYSANGSTTSEEPNIQRQQQNQLRNQPPGTTVTTTTTTTTTVTTVTSDGRIHTQVHPYNPSTDPPVRTQETTMGDESSRTSTLGTNSNTNSISNPNSANNIPQSQTQSKTNTKSTTTNLQPDPQGSDVQRITSPAVRKTPQEMQADSRFNIIPPTPQGSQSSKDNPRSPTTTGGRIIPARSDKRSSPRNSFGNGGFVPPGPDFLEDGPTSPGPPMRSEKRNSIDRGLNVAPLKTSHSPSNSGSRPISGVDSEPSRSSYEAPPHVPPKDTHEPYFAGHGPRDSDYDPNYTYAQHDQHLISPTNTYTPVGGSSSPLAYGGLSPNSRSHTPNQTRPGPTVTGPSFDAPPTSAQAQYTPEPTTEAHQAQQREKGYHRKSLANAYKGIQGASEALRGTINSGIAKGTHNKEEEERMRAIREKGLQDYKASGVGDRLFGGGRIVERNDGSRRLRRRSLSRNGVHGTEGPGGLEAVEERSIVEGQTGHVR